MEKYDLQKPCLVPTKQGFSVSYNNKLLYSKYNPEKLIQQTISDLTIFPGTIFLCLSPVLNYGVIELLNKLPENCFLLLCERDENLIEFSKSVYAQESSLGYLYKTIIASDKVAIPNVQELYLLPEILNKPDYIFSDRKALPAAGNFKRIIPISFSQGVQFHQEFYGELVQACTNAIMTFWSNRVTLVKFGRNYSSNFFTNLKQLSLADFIDSYFKSVNKPIVIFGAGQSIDKGILQIKDNRDNFYILCTDTSYTSLLQHQIYPDGVFVEEAQPIILKAFIGTERGNNTKIFTSLSSLPSINRNIPLENIVFFTTLYSQGSFLKNINDKGLLPFTNPPMGSVGLTTVFYALQFRENENVPVYLYGLDFSYSAGLTHGKGTLAHKTRLTATNRLNTVQNYGAAFNNTTTCFKDKSDNVFYTTHILKSYAASFISLFSPSKNLYDAADCGIDLRLEHKKPAVIPAVNKSVSIKETKDISEPLKAYFDNEIKELEYLKTILTGEVKLPPEESEKIVFNLIKDREYLYLHFPDGWKCSTELSFLKRVRIEIDYFLKVLKK